jgi:hypothetical protein
MLPLLDREPPAPCTMANLLPDGELLTLALMFRYVDQPIRPVELAILDDAAIVQRLHRIAKALYNYITCMG